MIPLLNAPSRVSRCFEGEGTEPSLAMVQRLRAHFGVPADVLIPRPKHARRTGKRPAATGEVYPALLIVGFNPATKRASPSRHAGGAVCRKPAWTDLCQGAQR